MKLVKECAILLLVLLVCASIHVWLAKRELDTLTPSSDSVSFTTFTNEMPPPRVLHHVKLRDGTERIVWGGEVANMIVPSGGSCYVFDGSGTLIDWSPTTGDGEKVDEVWQEVIAKTPITIDDAKEMLSAG